MSLSKQLLLEQVDKDRWREATKWLCVKLGRRVTHAEIHAAWHQFELEEAFEIAADKDD